MPGNATKRKRESGQFESGEGGRPSPQRPRNNLNQDEMRGDGQRGGGRGRGGPRRGGRGGGGRRDYNDNFRNLNSRPPTPTNPNAPGGRMSPPARPAASATPLPTPTPPPASPAQQPIRATPVPQIERRSPTPEPIAHPAPYIYSYVTPERTASWTDGGRSTVITIAKQAIAEGDVLALSALFQELVKASINGLLKPVEAGETAQEIIATPESEGMQQIDDLPGLFLDSVSVVAESQEYHPAFRHLLAASGVSHELMRETLESVLLPSLGLTRETFSKQAIRRATNLLYRQSNHNLLREETEGFAKLITELFVTSSKGPPNGDVVRESFERVKGLIGTFDLDVGRVLDVTLDVFASTLVKQNRFFIKFLRLSQWWPRSSIAPGYPMGNDDLPKWALPESFGYETTPEDREAAAPRRSERDTLFWERAREHGLDAFYELGGRRPIDEETKQRLSGAIASASEADREWIEATGTLPPSGNFVAAQLLGFKLRFYASEAREPEDEMPENLVFLAALMIKIGFISLKDLYPHLLPDDTDMDEYRIEKTKELAEKERKGRPGGGTNALLMAGALVDDTVPASRSRDTAKADTPEEKKEEPKPKMPDGKNQKALLLENLLVIGAIPEALFLIGKFPWLIEVDPESLKSLHRILHHSVDKVYEATKPTSDVAIILPEKKVLDVDQTGMPKGSIRLAEQPSPKVFRWPRADGEWEGGYYKFYWDDWADSIPVCQSIEDIFTLSDTLLNISGPQIGTDAALHAKLVAIGKMSLATDKSDANLARWQDMIKRLLVPALSFTSSNVALVNEVYDLLCYYPLHVRYNIYAEWYEGSTARLPAMVKAFKKARSETQFTMKRISKTNIGPMASALGKTAYANPGIVFKEALGQIESYPNLTEVVVACAKSLTGLGYDVLSWCLMSTLGGNRTRTRGLLLTSKWLMYLSNFTGKVFKRYATLNPAPILQYVNSQLYNGTATDLIILKELIGQMCGVIPDTDFTDAQLLGMTGGSVLRRQTLISLQDKRYESTKTTKRLMKALTETGLAGQLLITIAQYRQTALFRAPEEEAFIKVLSTTVDGTQEILMQFLDLLRSNLTVEQFDSLVPETLELIGQFGLEPALAFAIGRASYSARMEAATTVPASAAIEGAETSAAPSASLTKDADGDVSMDANEDGEISADAKEDEVKDEDVTMLTSMELSQIDTTTDSAADPWNEVLRPLIETILEVLPDKHWDLLTADFYATFWQLTLSDIQVPMDSYSAESSRLTKEITENSKNRSVSLAEKDRLRKELEDTKEKVLNESKEQMAQFGRTRSRLNKVKATWFSKVAGTNRYDALSDALLEECFLPRILLSPSDADYTFKMIKFLHNSGTPHFRTLSVYTHLFKPNRLRAIIFSCTIREAECLGRFLKSALSDLARWHANEKLYEKEAYGANKDSPGFALKLDADAKPVKLLDFEEFKRVLFLWHKNLNLALKACLGSDEWMHIRNGITVLKGVVEVFPAVNFMGAQFMTALKNIATREKDKREDLCLLANASMPELNKRKDKWVLPQGFASNLNDSMLASGSKEKPSTPTTLNAAAPEFKPMPTRNGSSPAKTEAKAPNGTSKDVVMTDAPFVTSASKPRQADERSQKSSDLPSKPAPVPARGTNDLIRGSSAPNFPNGPEPTPTRGGREDRRNRGSERRDAPRIDRDVDRSVDNSRYPPRDAPTSSDRPSRDRADSGRTQAPAPNPRDRFNVDPKVNPFDETLRARAAPPPMVDHRGVDLNARNSRPEPSSRRTEPARSDRVQPERGPAVNPDRLARIVDTIVKPSDSTGGPPSDVSRSGSQRGSRRDDRPRSRPQSPQRGDRRSGRTAAPDSHQPVQPRREEVQSGVGGPNAHDSGNQRRDNFPARGDRGVDRGREAFQPAPPAPRPVDPDHGRLNQPSRYEEPTYGRLTAAPDIPSGPRSHGGRNNRSFGQNMPSNDRREQPTPPPRVPTPTNRAPPTGPSSDRGNQRPTSAGASGPSVAAAPPVHPERLRQLAPEIQAQAIPPPPPAQPAVPPIHPSRMQGFQGEQQSGSPLPAHMQQQSNGRPSLPPINATPPTGPRGSGRNSQPSTPVTGKTPTGPSDRNGNDNFRRKFDVINATINDTGRSPRDRPVRGRGASQMDKAASFGSTPNAPGGGRQDMPPAPAGPTDDRQPPSGTRDFDRRERSGRNSGRSFRDRTPTGDQSTRDAPAAPTDLRDMASSNTGSSSRPELRDSRSSGNLRSERERERERLNRRASGRDIATPQHGSERGPGPRDRGFGVQSIDPRNGPSPAGGSFGQPPFGPGGGYGGNPMGPGGGGRDRGGERRDGGRNDGTPGSGNKRLRNDERGDRGREKRPRQG